jgi:transcriptional regulator with XRE-family HTH domain
MTEKRSPRKRRPAPSADTTRFLVGIGAVSRMIRARDRLSQAEVARRSGLEYKFIGRVEHGRANPNVRHMGQLAQGLGLAGAAELAAKAEEAARLIADATVRPDQ